jgi:hypothetical protein
MIPAELFYDGTLEGLFALLDRTRVSADSKERDLPRRVRRLAPAWGILPPGKAGSGDSQAGLFDEALPFGNPPVNRPAFPGFPPDPAALAGAAGDLFRASADAFDAFVYAWMSELPVDGEILRFGCKVLAAAEQAAGASSSRARQEAARLRAEMAAKDRGDGDVRAVMEASYKALHEIDRLMGFLRFSPDPRRGYTARCAPDGFVLPALAGHFTLRFGGEPWAIVDEKRGILLIREAGGEARLLPASAPFPRPGPDCGDRDPQDQDSWEKLWLRYHKAVNNEARKNPGLQRRFIPERYRQYLPELSDQHTSKGNG